MAIQLSLEEQVKGENSVLTQPLTRLMVLICLKQFSVTPTTFGSLSPPLEQKITKSLSLESPSCMTTGQAILTLEMFVEVTHPKCGQATEAPSGSGPLASQGQTA